MTRSLGDLVNEMKEKCDECNFEKALTSLATISAHTCPSQYSS